MESVARSLHVFFFPFPAQGHSIPMIDIARLFAARGHKSTIITTPLNVLLYTETIDRYKQSGLDIGVQIIPFPGVEAGLPEGCESLDSVTSPDMVLTFFKALGMLQDPLERLLEEHRPDCIVADMFFPWITDVANEHGVPGLLFHGTSNFSMCLYENIRRYAPQKKVTSDSEIFVVPGLPHKIELTKSQLPQHENDTENPFYEFREKIREAEVKSFGVLVNSFYQLEPSYVDYYIKGLGRRAWNIGPVSLYNRNIADKVHRGGKKSSVDEHHCMRWLDSKEPKSVLYVCFGSMSRFSTAQLLEIAAGLEASNVPFIWVVKMDNTKTAADEFLPTGCQERLEGKGLIIKDWAPQVLILDHPAVGGFMTHCGWNSVLEGISAGLPFMTWPLFAEQFNNEKLVTQVLKIGMRAGNEIWNSWFEANDVSVKRERVEEVATQLMGSGQEAQDMRRRAKALEDMAKRAVEEGGSSYLDLTGVIDELRVHSEQLNKLVQS